MNLSNLDNLVKTGLLKNEPMNQTEFEGLLRSGETRLLDAANEALSPESKFDLAYNAAHSLSLAALRWHGYRPSNRYLVFQTLPYTLGLTANVWRVLALCHDRRNLAEYEGHIDIDEILLKDLLNTAKTVLNQVRLLK